MFQKLNTQVKLRLLVIAGIGFLLLVYNLSIKKTIACYRETSELEQKLASLEGLPQRLKQLEAQLSLYTELKDSVNGENRQEELLTLVSEYCSQNYLLLKNFPKVVKGKESGYEIYTQAFSVEGPFIPVLKLASRLEQENRYGRLCSVSFRLQKDLKTGLESLLTVFYVQSVSKQK